MDIIERATRNLALNLLEHTHSSQHTHPDSVHDRHYLTFFFFCSVRSYGCVFGFIIVHDVFVYHIAKPVVHAWNRTGFLFSKVAEHECTLRRISTNNFTLQNFTHRHRKIWKINKNGQVLTLSFFPALLRWIILFFPSCSIRFRHSIFRRDDEGSLWPIRFAQVPVYLHQCFFSSLVRQSLASGRILLGKCHNQMLWFFFSFTMNLAVNQRTPTLFHYNTFTFRSIGIRFFFASYLFSCVVKFTCISFFPVIESWT